jgi:hypothetical protein
MFWPMSSADAASKTRSDPRVAAALAALQRRGRAEFEQSPLGGMARWVETGAPPPAALLRAQGFSSRAPGAGQAAAEAEGRLLLVHQWFSETWGFSIPCAEAVCALRALEPLVEIGCGAGYWTALLKAAGHDAIATDVKASGAEAYRFAVGRYCDVEQLAGTEAVRRYPERDVFCSWPTRDAPWALGAAWALAPGRSFALIGDGPGGIIGSRGLYRYLATRFDLVAEVALPQFPNSNDRLTVHRKRAAAG